MAKRGPKGPSKYTKKYIDDLADEMLDFFKNDVNNWHVIDFCVYKLFDKSRIQEFAAQNRKFSVALNIVKTICEQRIINNAYRMRNPTFGLFDLKCNHAWVDKTAVDMNHSGDVGLNITFNAIPDSTYGE